MSPPHLSVSGLSVAKRDGAAILDDVTFACAPGDCLAVVGASGSGKSTLALALTGLLDPALSVTAGRALLTRRDGASADLATLSADERRRLAGREIAPIFQDPLAALNPIRTVGTQVAEAIAVHERLDRPRLHERVVEALAEARLSQPERIARMLPGELSGGMRQRALIALALAARPRLVIADEPTTALDVTLQAEIIALLSELRRAQGLTLVLITHDMGVVAELADRVIVLDGGKVVEMADVCGLFDTPRSEPARRLIASLPRPRKDAGSAPPAGPPVATLDGLSVRYRERGLLRRRLLPPAVSGASFRLHPGEIFGLVGGSGSGKTTLGKALLGLEPPSAGRIAFHHGDAAQPPPRFRLVQAVFQDPASSLNPRRRVESLIAEPLLLHERAGAAHRRRRVAALMDKVGLDPALARRYPSALSGGQQQRVAIARALALEPRIIVADEALSALDTTVQVRILALFRRLASEDGVAVLMISHDLAVVGQVCDRVAVMEAGRIVDLGTPWRVLTEPRSEAARRLIDAVPARHPRDRRARAPVPLDGIA